MRIACPPPWATIRSSRPGRLRREGTRDSCAASSCSLTVLSWRLGALPLTELWWRYTALGGAQPRSALAAYLAGAAAWPDAEHNVLAHPLNENLWDLGISSLAPRRERPDARPTAGSSDRPRPAGGDSAVAGDGGAHGLVPRSAGCGTGVADGGGGGRTGRG